LALAKTPAKRRSDPKVRASAAAYAEQVAAEQVDLSLKDHPENMKAARKRRLTKGRNQPLDLSDCSVRWCSSIRRGIRRV
jgi:hypothetical protein